MKMKLLTIVAIASLVVCCVSQGYAFGMPKLKSPVGGGGAKVDATALAAQNGAVIYHCKVATIYVAKSLIKIETAIGNKTEADKLTAAVKAFDPPKQDASTASDKDKSATTDGTSTASTNNAEQKSSDGTSTTDPGTLKVAMDEVNTASADIDHVDLQAKMDKDMATKEMRQSLLYLGGGILVDTKVVGDTKTQIDQTKNAITSISADPLQISSLKTLKNSLETLQFLLSNVPGQLKTMGAVNTKLHDYAQTHALDTPSDAEVNKLSDDMSKG
jgi:hypothetical protein